MEGLAFSIGVIGNITSMMVFLSPISTFWRIVKNKSTEEFESLPYICALLSSSLWTCYGLVKPGAFLVATVNGFGIVVEIIYLGIFLLFAPRKMKVKTALLMGVLNVGFLGLAILVPKLALGRQEGIVTMGFLCAALNIIMYGSPLASMRTVMRTKSVKYMPFLLSFFLFLSGGIWALYGWLVRDYFLWVPNGTGFILGATQLILYAIYRAPQPPTTTKISICTTHPSSFDHQHRQPLIIVNTNN